MKKTAALIHRLIELCNGANLPDNLLRGEWFHQLQTDGMLIAITHGSRKSWRAANTQSLRRYISDYFDIANLEESYRIISKKEKSRAEMVTATGDSKFIKHRTFTGFLVNCYVPIEASINGQPFMLYPVEGSFLFIYDYTRFIIPEDVIIVGIENAENFRNIQKQRSFFEQAVSPKAPLLFVSRYPQNGDLTRWLRTIPNHYVHFGDLDLAGISIYLTEFYKHLGLRASFLVPKDYETRISTGSHSRYDDQYLKYHNMEITDIRVRPLVDFINKIHKGYDQEGFITQ